MFKLVYKNKKGVTLIELIVALAIVGLVLALSSTIFNLFTSTHEMGTRRWQVQNAVRLASSKFETETDLITNSKMLDVFYDETVANGITYSQHPLMIRMTLTII